MLSIIFTTFASKKICVGLATPVVPLVDVNMSRLMDFLIVMSSKQRGFCKIYQHWVDARIGKSGDRQIMYGYICPPFQEKEKRSEIKLYESMKAEYQKEKYASAFQDFVSENEDYTKNYLREFVEKVLKHPENFKGDRGGLDKDLISLGLNLKIRDAVLVKKLCQLEMIKESKEE